MNAATAIGRDEIDPLTEAGHADTAARDSAFIKENRT